MKLHFYVLLITAFLVYDIYHESYFTKQIKLNKKYITMAAYGIGGLIVFYVLKSKSKHSKPMIEGLSALIHYMPLDKTSSSFVSPFLDLTRNAVFANNNTHNGVDNYNSSMNAHHDANIQMMEQNPYMKRVLDSGLNRNQNGKMKRSVSETKKKYVASHQYWKCKHCQNMLDATFEVDHVIELQDGGSNHVSNLVALCRNCHGKKTMLSHL